MRRIAIDRARAQLESARASLESFKGGGSYREMERYWLNFLGDAHRVYEQLKAGLDVVESDRRWWDKAKHERRADQLLNYIHAARNADEHTLISSTARNDKTIHVTGYDGSTLNIGTNSDAISLSAPHGVNRTVQITAGSLRLVEVQVGRQRVVVAPPAEHQGVVMRDCSPIGVGEVTVEYLSTLIDSAEAELCG